MIANYDGLYGMHWVDPNLSLSSFSRLPTLLIMGFDVYPCLKYYNVQCMKLPFDVNCGGK